MAYLRKFWGILAFEWLFFLKFICILKLEKVKSKNSKNLYLMDGMYV